MSSREAAWRTRRGGGRPPQIQAPRAAGRPLDSLEQLATKDRKIRKRVDLRGLSGLAVLLLLSADLTEAQSSEEELRALGYISHPGESARKTLAGKTGLVAHRPAEVAPGFTLITALPEASAVLVDVEGRTVREWRDPNARQWARAILLDNGDVFVKGRLDAGQKKLSRAARGGGSPATDPLDGEPWYPLDGHYLARYGWDGTLEWRRGAIVHHDMEVDDRGRILTLGLGSREVEGQRIIDHRIVLLSPTGEKKARYSLFALLSSNPEVFELPLTTDHPAALFADGRLDLLHSNAIERMPFDHLLDRGGIYCRTCVLVTVRHQNLVAVFDLELEKLLWVWGPGELEFPHEGRWLKNGNVLIFDNGSERRGYSRIVEVEPASGKIVWSYTAIRPKDFYSEGRGTSQALANGNVLIASSNQGKVFEVTRAGRVVWLYAVRDSNGNLVAMRAEKYPPTKVEPLLSPSFAGSGGADSAPAQGAIR
ncbi:MAG: arylsulfotransferase family protein [Acidobacteriota bacterium]